MSDDQEEDDAVVCVCGRRLYEPASRALGLGPVCRRALRTPPAAAPGQLALDIETEDL